MNIHQNWNSTAFERRPVAAAVGPFASSRYLEAAWRLGPGSGGELMIAESDSGLIAFELLEGRLRLVGHEDLVDYRSPLGTRTGELLSDVLDRLVPGTPFVLDSLPQEAVDEITASLGTRQVEVGPHTTAAVLDLPGSFDEYLAAIGKRERHELRRKRRRFEEGAGPAKLDRSDSPDILAEFVAMHRRSEGAKGAFMTDPMHAYFRALLDQTGWGIDYLATSDGSIAAAAFSFIDGDGCFLYNSAFDPDLGHLSPGQVMLGSMIERAIAERCRVFDFLKGDEKYKFRLGATQRPLFEIAGVA